MADNKLFLGIQLVYPTVYLSAAERGDPQRPIADNLYLVVWPLLGPGSPALTEYFSHPHAPDPATGGGSAAERLLAGVELAWLGADRGEITGVPVPLPPGGRLELTAGVDLAGLLPPRLLGAPEPPFAPRPEDWAELAAENDLRFYKFFAGFDRSWWWDAARSQPRLSSEEEGRLVEWGIELLQGMLASASLPDLATAPPEIHQELRQPYLSELAAGEIDRERWRRFLLVPRADGEPRLLWVYLRMVEHSARRSHGDPGAPRLLVPMLEYDGGDLEQHAVSFFRAANDTYVEHLWQSFHGRVAAEGSAVEPELRDALQRTFGVGERLMWNLDGAVAGQSQLMVLPGTSKKKQRPPNWRWTNVPSLLGLAFGLPFARRELLRDAAEGLSGLTFGLPGNPAAVTGFDAAAFRDYADVFLGECEAALALPQPFSLAVETPTAASNSVGRILFSPKMSVLDPAREVPAKHEGKVWEVPAPLLDALEEQEELALPLADPADPTALFAEQTPQRLMVDASDHGEVIAAAAQHDLIAESGALRVPVTIGREALTGLDRLAEPQALLRVALDPSAYGTGEMQGRLGAADLAYVEERLKDPAGAAVWFGDGTAVREVVLDRSSVRPAGDTVAFLLATTVQGSPLKPLLDRLEALETQPQSPGDRPPPVQLKASLIFRKAAGESRIRRFNLLIDNTATTGRTLIALRKFFEFRVYNSSEHLYRRFDLRFRRHASLPELGETFAHAFKAWVWIERQGAGLGPPRVRLTERDHLLPRPALWRPGSLPPGETTIGTPLAVGMVETDKRRYELWHEFSTPVRSHEQLSEERRLAAEEQRYRQFLNAGADFSLVVAADNALGYRREAETADTRRLPMTTPVAHPALCHASLEESGGASREDVPMLSVDYRSGIREGGSDVYGEVVLCFNRRYFEEALRPPERPGGGAEAAPSAPLRGSAALREVYETLMDLSTRRTFDATEADNEIDVVLERWNFDNRRESASVVADAAEGFPNILRALRHVQTWRLGLHELPATSDDPRRAWHDTIADLLQPTYGEFLEALTAAVSAPDFDRRFCFRLPADPTIWRIEPAEPGQDEPAFIARRTNVVRVGLEIRRGSRRIPDPNLRPVAEKDLHPVEVEVAPSARVRGLPGMLRARPPVAPPALDADDEAELKRLRADAAERAMRYLGLGGDAKKRSDVCCFFAWLPAAAGPLFEPSGALMENRDPARAQKLLGPAWPYSLLPGGLRRDDGQRDVRLFSMPLAFVALPASELFDDRASSNQFFCYLLGVLQDLCEGRSPAGVELDLESAATQVEDLLEERTNARTLRRQVAGELVERFLTYVDDFDGELQRWDGYRRPDGNRAESAAVVEYQKELLRRVERLRRDVFDAAGSPARGAVRSLLERDLRSYERFKAYALHLFDAPVPAGAGPARENERLYSALITKYPRQQLRFTVADLLEVAAVQTALRQPATPQLTALRRLLDHVWDDPDAALADPAKLVEGLNRVLDGFDLAAELPLGGLELPGEVWRLQTCLGSWVQPQHAALRHRLRMRQNRLLVELLLDPEHEDPAKRRLARIERHDADRFTYVNFLQADGARRFLVDPLDDATYDSEFEILPHLTLGRSAEDVLEQVNELSVTAAKAQPPPRSLEVFSEPYNPEWREWRSLGHGQPAEPTRWYTVLPSRQPPSAPVPVEVDETQRPTAPGREWLNPRQHLFPEALDNPTAAAERYRERIDTWLSLQDQPVYIADHSESLEQVDESRPSELWPEERLDEISKGWHYLESYISHFHFEVRPDEEMTPENPLDGFTNDTFRIEVEELPIDALGRQAASLGSGGGPPEDSEGLLGWFKFRHGQDRRDSEGPDATREVVPPPKMPVSKVLADLDKHLGRNGLLAPSSRPLVLPAATAARIRRRVTRLSVSSDSRKLQLSETRAGRFDNPVMGQIIDAHFLSYTPSGGPAEEGGLKIVLRLSVLCSSWSRYRLRLRVRRNTRDVDHDGDSDMNPLFRMESVDSPWVDNGHFICQRSPRIPGSLPAGLLTLPGDPAAAVTKEMWEALASTGAAGEEVRDFGDPLRATFDKTGDYWQLVQDPTVGEHTVTGVHLSHLPFRHPVSPNDEKARALYRERDQFQSRAVARARSSETAKLFQVSKAASPSVAKAVRLTWWYAEKFPVLVIDQWPFRWAR